MSVTSSSFSRIEIEASEWLVAMSDRTVSLEERAKFESWLKADPEHARIYGAQKSAWHATARMPHLLEEALASELPVSSSRHSPSWYAAIAASFALVALAGVLAVSHFGWPWRGTQYETAAAQVKDVKLEDGTLVTLGAASHIDVEFGKGVRRVLLTRGEAFFEVARDTNRPFVVTAGDTQVRVLGTKFDVHYGPRTVRVSVLEGRVEVVKVGEEVGAATPHPDARKQVLTAGEAAIAEKSGVIATTASLKSEDLGAWRQGRLVYVDARLRDVVADINRYYDGRIELADDTVGDMQLTAAFRADQIGRMLEVLEGSLPVRVERPDDDRIVLSSR